MRQSKGCEDGSREEDGEEEMQKEKEKGVSGGQLKWRETVRKVRKGFWVLQEKGKIEFR